MKIVNTDLDTHALVYDGEQYEADEQGLFEVPETVGAALVAFPQWNTHDGIQPVREPEPVIVPAPEPVVVPVEPAPSPSVVAPELGKALTEPEPPVEPSTEPLPDGWDAAKKPALVDLATARGLDADGTVAELRDRLAAWATTP